MSYRTTFTDPAAVEAWDAWFRWRHAGILHDRTIDSTWARVVEAVTPVEKDNAGSWSQRWLHGLSRWQWLPDERLLHDAGTGTTPQRSGPITATLNLNAFARPRSFGAMRPELDTRAIAETAATTLRFLDDALLAMPAPEDLGLRIGILGFSDALDALGIEYDGPAALQTAHDAGLALAAGALHGAIELARERGGREPDRSRLEFLANHGLQRSLVGEALRWGVRHEIRTAIASAPRLAMLANNVSDALDPLRPRPTAGHGKDRDRAPPPLPSPAAQQRLRLAMQPWIDQPIDYPFIALADRWNTPD